MKKDLKGFRIGGHDDQVGDTAIKGFGGFVGTLLELFHVAPLLHCIQNGNSELSISKRVGFRVNYKKRKGKWGEKVLVREFGKILFI